MSVSARTLPSDVPRCACSPVLHFGGPDLPARVLRDLLQQRIDAVPAGGSIDWMTYYFRDEALADALVRAHRRGVAVRLCLEKCPRHRLANDPVIRLLGDSHLGLGPGLVAVGHLLPLHLHTKLYAFSHPVPTAFVGSFNPSGNDPEDPRVVADIGDQDRGHNLLVELTDPPLVAALVQRVAKLHSDNGAFRWRTEVAAAPIRSTNMEAWYFPLLHPNPLLNRFHTLGPGATLRIAASHVRDPFVLRKLAQLVRRKVEVTLLTGNTMRRTPRRADRYLVRHGIKVLRFADPTGLPMHGKFMLADNSGERWASFGSYNLTLTSRWLNHELLMFSADPQLWSQLDSRWSEMLKGQASEAP